MTSLRRRLRSFAWLALVVMFGLALGPTVSRSLDLARSSGGSTDHVASTALLPAQAGHAHHHHAGDEPAPPGSKHDPVVSSGAPGDGPPTGELGSALPGGGQTDPPPGGGHGSAPPGTHDHLNHCPLCGVAAHAFVLVPAVPAALPAPAHTAAGLASAVPTSHGHTLWASAEPRGPPLST